MKEVWETVYRKHQDESTSWEREDVNTGKPEVLKYLEGYPPPRKVLDIGCGRGKYSKYLEELGYHVISADISEAATSSTHKILKNPKVVVCNADCLPFNNNELNTCLDIGTLHHILEQNHVQYIKELERVLTKNGVYLFSAFNTKDSYKKPNSNSITSKLGTYIYFFDERYLTDLLSTEFSIIDLTSTSWNSKKTGAFHSAWVGICKKKT